MILERQTSGLVKQKVFIFLETLVEILKIRWDIFQKQMNFNLVWFPPNVTFPPLRKSQCVVSHYEGHTANARNDANNV